MNRKNKCFGWELLLDAYECEPLFLDDVNTIYDFLDEAVKVLGVTKMSPPYVFHAPSGYENSGGVSGYVPIIESCIQIHAMNKTNFVSVDYYTCGKIDKKMENNLIKLIKDYFRTNKIDKQLIKRGAKYYRYI